MCRCAGHHQRHVATATAVDRDLIGFLIDFELTFCLHCCVCAVCVSIGHTQVSMVSMSRQVGLTLCYLHHHHHHHHHHHQVAAAVHQASATFHTTLRWCTNSILFKHLAQLVTCATESVSVCLALLCQWPPPHDGGQAGKQTEAKVQLITTTNAAGDDGG